MDQPLLTIGIPTFNRAQFLHECLENTKKAIDASGFRDKIEIVISDNGSEDNTTEIVNNFQETFAACRYFRNPVNMEFDRNVANVLNHANGMWCWTMSDDEIMSQDALSFLYPFLTSEDQNISHICIDQGHHLHDLDSVFFKDGDEWLDKLGVTGGLLSQNIFRMQYLPADISKYFDNYWIHISIALEMKAKHACVLVKNLFLPPKVKRKTRFVRIDQVFDNFDHLNKMIANLPKFGYSQTAVDKVLANLAKGLPRNIASARLSGMPFSAKQLLYIVDRYKKYPIYLFFSVVFYCLPRRIIKELRKFNF